MQYEETVFRTTIHMLDNGASIDDTVKFYRIAHNRAAPGPVRNVKPKVDDPLLAQFRKEYPGAPSDSPATETQPRTNTANVKDVPLGLLERFRSAWPGAPRGTR